MGWSAPVADVSKRFGATIDGCAGAGQFNGSFIVLFNTSSCHRVPAIG